MVAGAPRRPPPETDKTGNWPAINEAFKRRGSLAIWLDQTMSSVAAPTGKRGRQPICSDPDALMVKVFGMDQGRKRLASPYSLLRLVFLDWAVAFVGRPFRWNDRKRDVAALCGEA